MKGGSHKWTISTVYARGSPKEFKEEITNPEQRYPEELMIFGGDLNTWIGEGRVYREGEIKGRRSKDKKVSKEGTWLLEWMEGDGV